MPSIEKVRELILKHGGRIVEDPGPSTFAVIAGELTPKVQKYAEKKQYNIAKVEWLVKILGSDKSPKELPKFHPKDMISCTQRLEDYFTMNFDEHRDSFTAPVDCASLKNLLDDMELDMCDRLLKSELVSIEEEIYGYCDEIRSFFRPFYIHFFAANQCHETKLAEIIFKSRHGNVIENLISSDCTHMAISPVQDLMYQFREQFPLSLQDGVQLVSIEWITKSHSQGKIVDISRYLIPHA